MKECSAANGLSALSNYIEDRSKNCQPGYLEDVHRVEFLKKAIIRYEGAMTALRKVNSNTQYQDLYTEWATALQFNEKEQAHKELKMNQTEALPTQSKTTYQKYF